MTTKASEADVSGRELLELAAKAAGVPSKVVGASSGSYWIEETKSTHLQWNPLTDDGDALRLAVKLGLELDFSNGSTAVADPERYSATYTHEFHAGEAMARTRLCIVRAAAAIAKGEKE